MGSLLSTGNRIQRLFNKATYAGMIDISVAHYLSPKSIKISNLEGLSINNSLRSLSSIGRILLLIRSPQWRFQSNRHNLERQSYLSPAANAIDPFKSGKLLLKPPGIFFGCGDHLFNGRINGIRSFPPGLLRSPETAQVPLQDPQQFPRQGPLAPEGSPRPQGCHPSTRKYPDWPCPG